MTLTTQFDVTFYLNQFFKFCILGTIQIVSSDMYR